MNVNSNHLKKYEKIYLFRRFRLTLVSRDTAFTFEYIREFS
jgi:hypothetical protein